MPGLKAELSKAFVSKWFLLPCCIATAIVIVAAIGGYLDDAKGAYALDYISTKWLDCTISSCYKYNILADFTQPASDIFGRLKSQSQNAGLNAKIALSPARTGCSLLRSLLQCTE